MYQWERGFGLVKDGRLRCGWLWPQLLSSVQAALHSPWILDIDTTVKTLFGRQSGAEVSYNPHKPGRPSHALHAYFVSNLRMVLDVVVSSSKEHSVAHARPGLSDVLDSLSKEQLPALVRGDCGFGNEPFIAKLERRSQPYLFKLRQTSGVKKMLMRQFARQDWTTPGPRDQGWSAVEDTLKLAGWDKSRRVIVLRRAAKCDVARSRKAAEGQMELLLPNQDVELWEYAVLVRRRGNNSPPSSLLSSNRVWRKLLQRRKSRWTDGSRALSTGQSAMHNTPWRP